MHLRHTQCSPRHVRSGLPSAQQSVPIDHSFAKVLIEARNLSISSVLPHSAQAWQPLRLKNPFSRICCSKLEENTYSDNPCTRKPTIQNLNLLFPEVVNRLEWTTNHLPLLVQKGFSPQLGKCITTGKVYPISMHCFMGELRCHAIQEAFELRSDESHASPASENARISPIHAVQFRKHSCTSWDDCNTVIPWFMY